MYSIASDITQPAGLTADQLEALISSTGLAGLGSAFKKAEDKSGVNAVFMIAHAAIESAWGKSEIAQEKNNLFGIDAYDSDPGQAKSFKNFEACIAWYANWLAKEYLSEGGAYFEGPTIHDVFIHYSSSHDVEASNLVKIINELVAETGVENAATSPAQDGIRTTYTVVPGDNLWSIAQRYGITLGRLERANPQFSDNFDLIHPGDQVYIPR